MANVRIYENSMIIQKYFRTPLKRDKKVSYPGTPLVLLRPGTWH